MRRKNQLRITRIVTAAGDVAMQLQSLHFANFRPLAKSWQPAMDGYFGTAGIDLCFDLAGVCREDIEIVAEPERIVLRGSRCAPRPEVKESPIKCEQLFVMEIENGAFARVVDLPRRIDPSKTTAHQRDGFLWLHLPFSKESL